MSLFNFLLSNISFKCSLYLSPNLILKNEGLLSTRSIGGKDYLDYEHSKAFAMVDHQMAHLYIKPGYDEKIKKIFESQQGISQVMDKNLPGDFFPGYGMTKRAIT